MLEKLELQHVGPAERILLAFKPWLNLLDGDNSGIGQSKTLDLPFPG